MTKSIIVADSQGRLKNHVIRDNEVVSRPLSAPASLQKEVKQQKITREELFVHPSAGRVLIQEDFFEYKGKIIVPDQSERRPTTGEILEVGLGVENYLPGQKVVYGLYAGTVVEFAGWSPDTRIIFRILGQDEILGTIDAIPETPKFLGVGA